MPDRQRRFGAPGPRAVPGQWSVTHYNLLGFNWQSARRVGFRPRLGGARGISVPEFGRIPSCSGSQGAPCLPSLAKITLEVGRCKSWTCRGVPVCPALSGLDLALLVRTNSPGQAGTMRALELHLHGFIPGVLSQQGADAFLAGWLYCMFDVVDLRIPTINLWACAGIPHDKCIPLRER